MTTTDKKDEALKLALEALLSWGKGFPDNWGDLDTEAVTAIREALAEQPRLLSAAPCDQCGYNGPGYYQPDTHQCAAKHHKALAEQPAQQQEPVAWMDGYRNIYSLEEKAAGCEDAVIPLVPATLQHWSDCAVHSAPAYPAGECDCGGYTSPPASKPWVGLTEKEVYDLADADPHGGALRLYHAIEAKLKEKNT